MSYLLAGAGIALAGVCEVMAVGGVAASVQDGTTWTGLVVWAFLGTLAVAANLLVWAGSRLMLTRGR
jgi:hypothetical protein